ncbi:MAG: histidine--tRNA ligase [Pelagibacteraceae bacterium TMED246]|nr:MAG: histidine--tRNA ligase [Pelagibacteraceae bacterium TMED246]|tara:strand:- start:3950 stop:5200 length:1251 start_codon:yes stop_codon:yes gene_type:complete
MIKNIKGTKDLLPNTTYNLQDIENHLMRFFHIHGYGEIRTPIFETTELFIRSVGETTDIVNKEMYTWEDQNGQSLTLRPEMTASVVRAYIQKQLWKIEPISKFFYIGPLFRRERPQKGRLRQFHQFGIEAIGSENPEQDAEVISIAYNIYKMFGVEDLSIKINSIGSGNIRDKFSKDLKSSLNKFKASFSESELNRLEKNPLRILDSKNSEIKKIVKENAPNIFDYISKEDKIHFKSVLSILDDMSIPYIHDNLLVRGLDYYNKTVFEVISSKLGGQDALCGGGRYDQLIAQLGGSNIPAMGFAAGIERLIIAMNLSDKQPITSDIYIINTESTLISESMIIADNIRKNLGVAVYVDTLRRSLKSQLRHSNKMESKFSIILDSKTVNKNTVSIKNMEENIQEEINIDNIISYFESK